MKNKKQNEPKIYATMLTVYVPSTVPSPWKYWKIWAADVDHTLARLEGPYIIYQDGAIHFNHVNNEK
jgi:hypothetical protein